MKKIAISLAALSLLGGAAFADQWDNNYGRSYDLRDSDTYMGKFAKKKLINKGATVIVGAAAELSREELEQRRIDEQNN